MKYILLRLPLDIFLVYVFLTYLFFGLEPLILIKLTERIVLALKLVEAVLIGKIAVNTYSRLKASLGYALSVKECLVITVCLIDICTSLSDGLVKLGYLCVMRLVEPCDLFSRLLLSLLDTVLAVLLGLTHLLIDLGDPCLVFLGESLYLGKVSRLKLFDLGKVSRLKLREVLCSGFIDAKQQGCLAELVAMCSILEMADRADCEYEFFLRT